MNKLTVMLIALLSCCTVFLNACGLEMQSMSDIEKAEVKNKSAAMKSRELVSHAQDNIHSAVGQDFMTVKLEDATAYTWDQGPERDELQGKLNTMLFSLTVKKVGVKKRPSPFVAILFENTSIIIPYTVKNPEKNIIIEDDEGTFVGECSKENLISVLEWLKEHKVKIGK
jgi:hypothetical protein